MFVFHSVSPLYIFGNNVSASEMEEKITFENILYGDEKEITIDDIEFCVDRIVMLTKYHP